VKKKTKASKAMRRAPRQSRNPKHAEGSCSRCGEEMVFVEPSLGSGAGFVHKVTRRFGCKDMPPGQPQPEVKTS
jgi:hypothetical protein